MRAVLLLAGFEAERRFDPEGARSEWANHDHHTAINLARYLTGSDATLEAYLAYVDVCARELVETHWSEIKAVAAALLKTPTLRGPAIREIVMGLHYPLPEAMKARP